MKKKLSALLAIVLAFCMSVPVLAATPYPTDGYPAEGDITFSIEKNYMNLEGNASAAKFPDETLKFESTCKAAPMDTTQAPELTVNDLKVTGAKNNIDITVPTYTVPGKYNYEIKELSPSKQDPVLADSAGVLYDEESVFIQVVVKYDGKDLKKFVTVAADGTTIGNGNNDTQDNKKKKGDFKNKYLLDGEIDPDIQKPDPDPYPDPEGPNPIPNPDKPDPDPIIPIPNPEGNKPDTTELAKFKIMKQVRGPLANHKTEFGVTVTLNSKKPVRSDISYNGAENGIISKVDADNSGWTGNDIDGYTAIVEFRLQDEETVVFSGVPAGVSYKVQEDGKHIGPLTDKNLNDPNTGYTVAYYGGGDKITNPTPDAPTKDYGASLVASGMVGKDKNNNIIIANSKGMNNEDSEMVKPNTGLHLDSLPYIMILGVVVLGAGMMLVRSRKRREE